MLVKEPSGLGETTLLNLLAGLNEPTGQLDTLTGASIITLLKEVTTQTGVTVVIAGHGPNVEQVADVIYQLQDGRLVGKLERGNPSFVIGRSPSIARRPSRSSGPSGVT